MKRSRTTLCIVLLVPMIVCGKVWAQATAPASAGTKFEVLGATIVDPGNGGALFQDCLDQYLPHNLNTLFTRQFPSIFPAGTDHISILEDMFYGLSSDNGSGRIYYSSI